MAAVQNIQQRQVKEGRVCLPPKRAVEVWQQELNTHGHSQEAEDMNASFQLVFLLIQPGNFSL